MTITFQKLTSTIGAGVLGANLRLPLSDSERSLLRAGLHQYLVLVIQGQEPSADQLVDFAEAFGPIKRNPLGGEYVHHELPEIFVLTNKMVGDRLSPTRDVGDEWHTDNLFTTRLAAGAVL